MSFPVKLPVALNLRRQTIVGNYNDSELMNVIVSQAVRDFSYLKGTTDKRGILQLLLFVMTELKEDDSVVADQLHSIAFTRICRELCIEDCVIKKVLRSLDLFCGKRLLACFAC